MPERADVFQMRLGLGLHRFWQSVQHICRLVDPAALHPGLAVNLMQRGPEPHGTIADSQLGCGFQPPAFEVQEQLAPALGAFAKAVDQAQNIFVAPLIRPDNHQHTLAILVHAGAEVDAVGPEIHIAPCRQIPFGPAFIILPPVGLQPGDGAGGQAWRIRSQERSQGFREISRGNALEVKPGQQFLDRLCAPQIGRKDRRGELQPTTLWRPIPHPGHFHRHRADPGLNLALGQMAVPNQPATTGGIGLIGMGSEKGIQLGLDRLSDQIPRALAQQIRQRVGRKSFWRAKRDNRILRHVAYPFLCENCGASTTP